MTRKALLIYEDELQKLNWTDKTEMVHEILSRKYEPFGELIDWCDAFDPSYENITVSMILKKIGELKRKYG